MSIQVGLGIIRQRIWYNHTKSPLIEVINEYTLVNQTNTDISDIFLLDLPLMPELQAYDENNKQLTFLSNKQVREQLDPLFSQSPSDPFLKSIEYVKEHGPPYFLWITLSEDDKMKPGDNKIIKLKYRQNKSDLTPNIRVSGFSVRRYGVLVSKRKDDYDLFIHISSPEGYMIEYGAIAWNSNTKKLLTEEEGFYKTDLGDFKQIRLPAGSDIVCQIGYDVLPPKNDRLFFKLTLFSLSYISALLILSAWLNKQDIFHSISSSGQIHTPAEYFLFHVNVIMQRILNKLFEISSAIVGVSIAIPGLVRDPLFNRARWGFLAPAMMSIFAFLFHG